MTHVGSIASHDAKNEWLLEVFMAFGICNQTKLVRSKFFFYKIGLKMGVFFLGLDIATK